MTLLSDWARSISNYCQLNKFRLKKYGLYLSVHDAFFILNYHLIFVQVVNIANKTRLGLTQVFQLQSITAKLDQLGHKLQASAQRFKLAIRTNGNYVIHGRLQLLLVDLNYLIFLLRNYFLVS